VGNIRPIGTTKPADGPHPGALADLIDAALRSLDGDRLGTMVVVRPVAC